MSTVMDQTAVRALTREELQACLPLGLQFWQEAVRLDRFDPAVALRTWTRLIELDRGAIFGWWHEGRLAGMMGCILGPMLYCEGLCAEEAFWFVEPSQRGGFAALKLLRAFERWAIAKGAVMLGLAHYSHLHGDKLPRLYARMGYRLREVHYGRVCQ